MHIFLDTNVLLSFYHYSDDDLEELRKLIVLIQTKKVQLHLPTQVRAEFRRNRDAKVADALKKLREQGLNLKYPQISKDYAEYSALRTLRKEYESRHAELINKLNDDAREYKLKADSIIEQLFRIAEEPPCCDPVLTRAKDRVAVGNPPGKQGSLGDAVNWEALLETVQNNAVLHFISGDGDYCSALDSDTFAPFLAQEWKDRKGSGLQYYRRLSAFFKEHFPEITLAMELEKDLLISDLAESPNFARTHSLVAKLARFSEFSAAQLNAIALAVVSNNQVYMIADDDDVLAFLNSTLFAKATDVDPELLKSVKAHAGPPAATADEDDEIPF